MSDAVSPAKRAERTPGRPPSASASIPESSAIAGAPVASAAARALISAFSSNVSPVSGGSSTASGSGSSGASGSSRWNSRSLWALRVARTSRAMPCGYPVALAWTARRPSMPALGQGEELVEVRARERRALGGRLDLDEAAFAGHDDVGVDLRARVLRVVEVEQRLAVDDAAGDGGDRAGERQRGELALVDQAPAGELERDVAAGDRGAARAAVGLQDVAVDVDGALAELGEVDDAADRAADQPLDLDGAAVGAALGDVALLAVAGGGGEHPVLRRQPAAALPLHPARHRLVDRRGADHLRLAARDQRRPGGRTHEVRLDRDLAELVGGPAAAALAAHAAARSRRSTCSTGPSGICRKRVPSAENASTSPVERKA